MTDQYTRTLRFEFFKYLTNEQRLRILIDLGALPEDTEAMYYHTIQDMGLKRIERDGKLAELEQKIKEARNS
jgi:hypothetical protein